jgi:DNA-directed RNA polymerase specialized sigma24 family protein
MSESKTEVDQGPAATLSQSEILAELKSLTNGQKTALVKKARLYAQATAYGYEDLIQETYSRLLAGDRKWRRDLSAVPLLSGVMRSVAWDWKRKDGPLSEDLEIGDDGAEARGMLARLDVQAVLSLFDDDPVAKRMVVEMMYGAKGDELQAACGLSQTDYESKRKKIRRRLEKWGTKEGNVSCKKEL